MADTPVHASDVVVGKFYRAVHSDQCGPNDFPFIVSLAHDIHRRPGDPPSTPAAWGFSVYRRVAAYRTLGSDFATWAARPANAGMVIYEDRDRRLDKPPRSPTWASVEKPPAPRAADHCVVRFGPDVPPNVLRRVCLGCGDANDFPLPASVEDVIRSGKSFAKRHKACRQPSDSNKSPNPAPGGDTSGVENER